MELKQAFVIETPEGIKTFATKAEAQDYLRRPKVLEALNKLTDNNGDLSTWLLDNQETMEAAFDTGTIRRVSKSERKKLDDALAFIVDTANGNAEKKIPANSEFAKKAAFVVENAAAIAEVFRWPTVKRMNDEEKAAAAQEALNAVTENPELTAWILSSKDAILEAYSAGVEKRQVNPKAQEALAAYRAQKAAEKAAKEAAEGGEGGKTE